MLDVGSKLPPFSLEDGEGQARTLSSLAGPRGLVLYFYPKDNTPGCTVEAMEFSAEVAAIRKVGFEVAGVSRDPVKAHYSFTEKHGLRIPLLSDPEATLIRAAGAWGEKKLRGRTYEGIIRSTLVVDRAGVVLLSYPVVKPQGHATAVYKDLRKL